MAHHASDTVADLASKLDKEDLFNNYPFRLNVHPAGEIVIGYEFVEMLSTEPVVYASAGRGNMVKDGYGNWETEYVPDGWNIDRLCDPAETLRGDVLRDMMDTAAECAPESYMIYAVEIANITKHDDDCTDPYDCLCDDDTVGWVILSRDVDAETVPSTLTSQGVREGDGAPYLVAVQAPIGWPDVEIGRRINIVTVDGVKFSGTVISVYGRSLSVQIDHDYLAEDGA